MIKLLDFWAEWCGPCKMMHPVLEEAKEHFAGKIEVTEINVDEEMEASAKYGVASIPTYILMDGEVELDRTTGATSKENFFAFIQKNLKTS